MAHLTSRSAWRNLEDRINRFPQGAPPSELLDRILRMLFSEREAELVSRLPIKPFTATTAAGDWQVPVVEARKMLDSLADRGLLIDCETNGETRWTLPPPMAGFFEFSLMRVRDDIDQTVLSELFHQYLNVEEEFIRALFTEGETRLGRTFINEEALTPENSLHVLDYERASEVIETATALAIGMCYCRHKMQHLERACDAPMNICMTMNNVASSLIRHGIARQVDRVEAMDLLDTARGERLVQFGENVRSEVSFICNCCGCCCEAMIAARRFGHLTPVHTTNFLPVIDTEVCRGCGKCAESCPVEAMGVVSANDPRRPRRKLARLDEKLCLGCGVCVTACERAALRLESRPERVITPLDSVEKTVVMAIERGMLQHLLFDRRALWSHRAMAAVLGVILKLPTVKRAMASKQMQSRYLDRLLAKARPATDLVGKDPGHSAPDRGRGIAEKGAEQFPDPTTGERQNGEAQY